jgi:hypothetical protein
MGPTHPPIQWVMRVLFPGVKWLGRETDPSRPFSAVPIFLLCAFMTLTWTTLHFYVGIFTFTCGHLYVYMWATLHLPLQP